MVRLELIQSSISATWSGSSLSLACIRRCDHWLMMWGSAVGDPVLGIDIRHGSRGCPNLLTSKQSSAGTGLVAALLFASFIPEKSMLSFFSLHTKGLRVHFFLLEYCFLFYFGTGSTDASIRRWHNDNQWILLLLYGATQRHISLFPFIRSSPRLWFIFISLI